MPPKLPRFRARVEQAKDAERLGRILLEVEVTQSDVPAGGESNRRGVPIIGGTAGAISGTSPEKALLSKQRRRR